MTVAVKRAQEEPARNDGQRVLVDRIWPRGIARKDLRLDGWLKELAPSSGLRKWFGHDPEKWDEFKKRYERELEEQEKAVGELAERAVHGRLTLVFAARDTEHNNAVALKEHLERRRRR
ncbi:DUF488 family protein [Geminicoccaceae bacterium 1502E]|nr:DUF488 family protein [Geminicoccaceae bacterium 1502E]